jgi:hypothetical protein
MSWSDGRAPSRARRLGHAGPCVPECAHSRGQWWWWCRRRRARSSCSTGWRQQGRRQSDLRHDRHGCESMACIPSNHCARSRVSPQPPGPHCQMRNCCRTNRISLPITSLARQPESDHLWCRQEQDRTLSHMCTHSHTHTVTHPTIDTPLLNTCAPDSIAKLHALAWCSLG